MLGFVIGLIVGACFGTIIVSLLVASKGNDDILEEEDYYEKL